MSALTDRIAEVLRQHRELRWSDNTYSCSCEWDASEGLKRGTSDEHFAHVAERVATELQLTEEQQDGLESGDDPRMESRVWRRWVMPYEEMKS